MALEAAQIKIGTAVSVTIATVVFLWNFYSWADEQHKSSEQLAREAAELAKEVKSSTDLIRQVQIQQAELVKRAADDARINRETLIRIEAKVDE